MNAAPAPAGHLLPPLFAPPHELAPYASRPATSRGRLYPEPESATRSCFQRDRDRIIHSTAFRRLKHKTQVFVQHEGDYYRTRLTHSLEVAQIARSMARLLAVDEDLAEALSLAHDLGHTPFGHAGEEALNKAALKVGGLTTTPMLFGWSRASSIATRRSTASISPGKRLKDSSSTTAR